jgi:hypothetical protein
MIDLLIYGAKIIIIMNIRKKFTEKMCVESRI